MPIGKLEGRRVLVTGGSSGIGRALAHRLVASGASVVIAARGRERLAATQGELEAMRVAAGQRLGAVPLDVDDPASVSAGVEQARELLGGLDVLIANQGYAATGHVERTPLSVYEDMLRTNYLGHVALTQAVVPHLVQQRSGAVCLVSSMLGFFGTVGYSAYAGSKHAVAGFAKCLRAELRQSNVTVTLAYVPTTDTPGLERENRTKPADTWALESGSQTFAPAQVAACILRAVERGRFEVTPGASSHAIWLLYRWFPRLVDAIMDRDLDRFHRRELAAGRDPRRLLAPPDGSG